jgi:ketosteroid isomerase-like protein
VSQENVEIAQSWFESFVSSDPDDFRDTLHPEIEWFPFEDNHSRSYGIDAAMRIRNAWLEPWEEMRSELEEIHARDDSVLASIHIMGRGKTSGVEVDTRLHLHFKIRDGKIVYLFEHTDRAAALEAAGMTEQDARPDLAHDPVRGD